MAQLIAVLHVPALAVLVAESAHREGLTLLREAVGASPARLARRAAGRGLIVHDFLPDAHRSAIWLEQVVRLESRLTVFALLHSPTSPVLGGLLRNMRGFVLAGGALAAEQTARSLAGLLSQAVGLGQQRELAADAAEAWRLDPVLAALAERALAAPQPHTRLNSLLAATGVGRKTFASHAHAAGFHPPLRFLHALRALDAIARMREHRTERDVARELGYGSTDTLRHHVREVAGITPREACQLTLSELLRRMAPGRERADAE